MSDQLTIVELLKRAKEQLSNVPIVGEIYDQQHSDDHMHMITLLDEEITEQESRSGS